MKEYILFRFTAKLLIIMADVCYRHKNRTKNIPELATGCNGWVSPLIYIASCAETVDMNHIKYLNSNDIASKDNTRVSGFHSVDLISEKSTEK